jgi:drug/metabolite transporter (DMT)-like permease
VTSAPPEADSPRRVVVHAALVAVQVAFATLSVAGKVVVRSLSPESLALVRLGGAALVFGAFWARGERRPIPAVDLARIAGCAALGIFGNQVLFLNGLRLTSAVNATVLVATIPIFTVLAASALGREPFRTRTLMGALVAFAGVVWLSTDPGRAGGVSGRLGDLLVALNALFYAVYLVLVRDLVARHGSLPVVAHGFAFAFVLSLPFGVPALWREAPFVSTEVWALTGYVILVPTVFTYLANAWALRFAPSSTVAIYIYLQPIVASVLAVVFLGEVPGPRVLVTALAVFAGVWLVTRGASASRARPAAASPVPGPRG